MFKSREQILINQTSKHLSYRTVTTSDPDVVSYIGKLVEHFNDGTHWIHEQVSRNIAW